MPDVREVHDSRPVNSGELYAQRQRHPDVAARVLEPFQREVVGRRKSSSWVVSCLTVRYLGHRLVEGTSVEQLPATTLPRTELDRIAERSSVVEPEQDRSEVSDTGKFVGTAEQVPDGTTLLVPEPGLLATQPLADLVPRLLEVRAHVRILVLVDLWGDRPALLGIDLDHPRGDRLPVVHVLVHLKVDGLRKSALVVDISASVKN